MLKRADTVRWIASAVLFVYVGLLLTVVITGIRNADQRQVLGCLAFDAGQLPAQTHDVGQFAITWELEGGGRLSISHRDQPNFAAWSSLPGLSFVTAGLGEEEVIEQRGHFRVDENLRAECADQTVDAITTGGDTLSIEGYLQCESGTSAPYTLAFTALSPNQLGFELSVEDPDLNRTYLSYASQRDEHFYGFGEQFSAFDLKGKRLPVFVNEQGIGRGLQPLTLVANLQYGVGGEWHNSYAAVPQYTTSQLRSLFLESSEYAVFDMRYPDRVQVQLFAPQMTGRILHGESPAELIAEYTSYAGRMRPLPAWVHEGAIVSLQGGTERVRQIVAQLEENDIPVTGVWLQDWVGQRTTSFGKQLWWNWELDEERYPDWEQLQSELAAKDIKVLTYINPFVTDVSDKPTYERRLFQEAVDQGFLVRDEAGDPYLIANSDFSAGLVDLTNPAATRLDARCHQR